MHDSRSRPDPDAFLNPLLERLAFIETDNDRLKTSLSDRNFNAEIQNIALREQLEQAKVELAGQQEALDNFCRELLAAAQARDGAQAESDEQLKLREAAVRERDDMSRRLDDAQRTSAGAEALKARLDESLRDAGTLQLQLDLARQAKVEVLRELAALRDETENGRRVSAAKEAELNLELEDVRRAEKIMRLQAGLSYAERAEAVEAALDRYRTHEAALREAQPPPAEPRMPPEELLDPVWAKALPALRRPLSAAYEHLRHLNLSVIPAGPRAMIRLAGASLTQTSDMLKTLEEFFDERAPAAAPGRAEAPLDAALAAWENAFKQRRIAIVRRVAPGLPQVLLCEESLRSAVFQVLLNAYEAMPRGGTLTLKASRESSTGGVLVRFSDTGPGFAPKTLTTLFTPFSAARPGHLGLGLCLARRVMRRFGGDVSAANASNKKGAVVTLRLAPHDAPLPQPPPGG